MLSQIQGQANKTKVHFFLFSCLSDMNISRIFKEKAGAEGNYLSAESSIHAFAWMHMDIHMPI